MDSKERRTESRNHGEVGRAARRHEEQAAAIHFLGLDAATGAPFYPRELSHGLAKLPERTRVLRPGLSASDLREAGWGVVFPRNIDPLIVKALKPLLDMRQEQAGTLYRELTYIPKEGPGVFLSRLRAGSGPVVPEIVPYFLMLVGDPATIPHGFQFDLEVQYAVGRIAFESVEAYGRYARSVVKSERDRRPRTKSLRLFSAGHAKDIASELARRGLVDPVERHLRRRLPAIDSIRVDGEHATKAALGEQICGGEGAIVLAAGHAALFQPTNPRQRSCQGAIVCADWPGHGPASSAHYFASGDLPADAGLGGRIFWLFGCHTAGTPRLDSFGPPGVKQRRRRRRLASEPFLAQLPQDLLSHPAGGALAVIGHVDRAFPQHMIKGRSDRQAQCFEDILFQLLQGKPLGLAMESLAHRQAELAARLVSGVLGAGDGDFRASDTAELWSAFCDARSHMVLGDPAVRLSI